MDHEEAGRYWNDNAEVWTRLSRSGYDVYRDFLNTPASLLPAVKGLSGLDTGFVIERVEEPRPSDETVRTCPYIQDAQVVAYFLHVRARKRAG